MPSIPDDGTMEAALYGSAHIETVLARENADRLLNTYSERIEYAMSVLDLDLAEAICVSAPSLIYSDQSLDPKIWNDDVRETVDLLRFIERQRMGMRLVQSWKDAADHRGRLIGLGEHSARASVSGSADADYKMATLRGGLR